VLPRWLDASSFIGHKNGGLININAPFVPKNIKINILYCAKARLNDIVGQGAMSVILFILESIFFRPQSLVKNYVHITFSTN
jgi:hypothetical protein